MINCELEAHSLFSLRYDITNDSSLLNFYSTLQRAMTWFFALLQKVVTTWRHPAFHFESAQLAFEFASVPALFALHFHTTRSRHGAQLDFHARLVELRFLALVQF